MAPARDVWLNDAIKLFRSLPKLSVLGGFRGRMDLGLIMDKRHNFYNGPKYGPMPSDPSEQKKCCNPLKHKEKKSGVPFMYVYKVRMLAYWHVDAFDAGCCR